MLPPRDITRGWLVANAVAGIVGAALGLAEYPVHQSLSVRGADASLVARVVSVSVAGAAAAVYFAIYAHLVGRALRQVVPALALRRWIVAHAAVGLILAAAASLFPFGPSDNEPVDLVADPWFAAFAVAFFMVVGLAIGAAFGGLQAFLLRGVAQGLRWWVGLSALSGLVILPIAALVLMAFPLPETFAGEAVMQAGVVVVIMVAAVVMLPALARLRPR